MTRKDKYYRLGSWMFCILFCVQSASFVLVLHRIKLERKKIENASSRISSFASAIADADFRSPSLDQVSECSSEDSSKVVFPYTIAIGSGRTKSHNGRVYLYTDFRTYTTNGVFTTSRKYYGTPLIVSNGAPVRACAPGGH